ncbi:putative S-adenosylmethionine-dependent methyltransferase involved in cell envelope biogenesis [Methylomicrobium album BG8]|uniref:Putative S-adenosylmethionine-dependent methyltransferase involved in cell envelope biogenesis n=1 Tax=Methylomicrobium album BG8 TaxID=686340 RepID=H8GJD0_METAL|nr:class I SAM-dependent methyltransferase [Methylomicrobium agile]EIC29120.1 putative S-adenosylmethionine-dependent methyltransferase involved in cell envelope biogenesis [Methylomicrobium album BG8]
MKKRISLVDIAHQLVGARLYPGAVAVDATVGNGYDTLFLLQKVAPAGRVYGFDIQQLALESVQDRMANPDFRDCLTLFHRSHAEMDEMLPQAQHGLVSAVMFNLGYLPGGDKSVITRAESTLAALSAASRLLSPEGIITIVAYPGHVGGAQECEQVRQWCARLDSGRFEFELIEAKPDDRAAPRLFAVNRKF